MEERILLHLQWMNINYAIRKDELPIGDNNTEADIALYDKWERSNRFDVMFIKD